MGAGSGLLSPAMAEHAYLEVFTCDRSQDALGYDLYFTFSRRDHERRIGVARTAFLNNALRSDLSPATVVESGTGRKERAWIELSVSSPLAK
jgi:hypothetical protein